MHLEVQVRTGGLTPVADVRDVLTGRDPLARVHVVRVHVAVDADRTVVPADVDRQAEAGRRPGALHDAGLHGEDARADGGRDVDAAVQRAPAPAVATRDPAG